MLLIEPVPVDGEFISRSPTVSTSDNNAFRCGRRRVVDPELNGLLSARPSDVGNPQVKDRPTIGKLPRIYGPRSAAAKRTRAQFNVPATDLRTADCCIENSAASGDTPHPR
jgi:hypothetical protein